MPNPYNSTIATKLREMWNCICKLQEQIGGDTPPAPAAPTVTVGLTAKAGVATTYMRSDGAPALDQGIAPIWTGIHTFNNDPVIKNVDPGIEFQTTTGTQLGFINFGTGAANVPAFINPLVADQLRIAVGTAPAATFSFGNAGQLGLGNPVNFGTAGQVLTSGGPTGALTWAAASGGANVADVTGLIGMTAVVGTANTAARSDGRHAIDPGIVPIWTGAHTFTGASTSLVPGVAVKNASPQFELWNTSGVLNSQRWNATAGPSNYILSILSDDGATISNVYRATRAANAVQSFEVFTNGVAIARQLIDVNGTTTFASTVVANTPSVRISSGLPTLELLNSTATANNQKWSFSGGTGGGTFILRALNDNGTPASGQNSTAIQIFRGGATIADVQIWAGGTMLIKAVQPSAGNAAVQIVGLNEAVSVQAASVTLTRSQSGTAIMNTGAAATVTYTLPPAVAATVGTYYDFVDVITTGGIIIRVLPDGTDTITDSSNNVTGGASPSLNSSTSSSVRVICVAAGKWQVLFDNSAQWNVGA